MDSGPEGRWRNLSEQLQFNKGDEVSAAKTGNPSP
jgi:hypothetical protein